MKKQINILEKEMNHFGLKLPEQPPKSINVTTNTDVLVDQLMFRRIFTSQQFMFDMDMAALRQTVTNDRIRKIYRKFLMEEIDIFNKLVNYGKIKGWTRPVPMFKVD